MKLTQSTVSKILNLLVFSYLIVLPSQIRHTFFNISQINGQFNEFWSVSIYGSDLVLAVLISWYLYAKIAQNEKISDYIKVFMGILGILLGLLAIFASTSHETFIHSIYTLVNWSKFGLVTGFFAEMWIENKELIYESVAASGLVQAVIGIAQFFKQSSIGLHWAGEQIISPAIAGVAKIDLDHSKLIRAYGLFAHPNQLAAFLLVACATVLFILLHEEVGNNRAFLIIIFWVLLVGEIVTFSRAGIITTVLALGSILLLERFKTKPGLLRQTTLSAFVCVLAALLIFSPYLSKRAVINDQSNISRLQYDRIGLQIFKQNLLGVGPGQLIVAVHNQMKQRAGEEPQPWQIQPPHNFFIDVSDETGIVGLALIIWFFAYLVFQLARDLTSHNILLLCIFLGFILLMQFDHYFYTLQQTQLLLWVVVGMIMAATGLYQQLIAD